MKKFYIFGGKNMKKVISLFMAMAILLTSAVSVFATGDYTIEKKDIY